jgi:hypothetical protein
VHAELKSSSSWFRGDNAKVHAFYESLGYYDQERVVFAKWLDGREPTP